VIPAPPSQLFGFFVKLQEIWQVILLNLFAFGWWLLAVVELFPGGFVSYAIKNRQKYVLQGLGVIPSV